jgi:hypothetical protein
LAAPIRIAAETKAGEITEASALPVSTGVGAIGRDEVGMRRNRRILRDVSAAENLRTGIERSALVRKNVSGERRSRVERRTAVIPVDSVVCIAIAPTN